MKARWELVSSSRRTVREGGSESRSIRSPVGQRLPARAPWLTATSMPAARNIAAVSAVVVVLPAVPVIPMLVAAPALEQEVAETGDVRALGAEPRDPRRGLGRPRVEVGDVRRTGRVVEIGARFDDDAAPAERRGVGGLGLVPGEPDAVSFLREKARQRDRVGPEAVDEDVHARIIAVANSRSRTYARRVSSGCPSPRARAVGRTLRRRGARGRAERDGRRTGSCSIPFLGALDEAVADRVAERVAAGPVEMLLGQNRTRVVRPLEEVSKVRWRRWKRIAYTLLSHCMPRCRPSRSARTTRWRWFPSRHQAYRCQACSATVLSRRSRKQSRSVTSSKIRQRPFPPVVTR